MLQRDRVTGLPLIPASANELAGLSGVAKIDWGNIIESSVKAGTDIARARYGGPQPGQYIQDGNSIRYNIPMGTNPLTTFPGQNFGGNFNLFNNPMLLLLILGFVVIAKR